MRASVQIMRCSARKRGEGGWKWAAMRAVAVCALESALADNALLHSHESRRVGEAWISSGADAHHDDLNVTRSSNFAPPCRRSEGHCVTVSVAKKA